MGIGRRTKLNVLHWHLSDDEGLELRVRQVFPRFATIWLRRPSFTKTVRDSGNRSVTAAAIAEFA